MIASEYLFGFENLSSFNKGLSKFEVYLPFELPVRPNSKNKTDRRIYYKGIKLPDQGGKE